MDDYVKAAVLENGIEAQLLESVLQERSIPYLMKSYHDAAYDGLFQTQKGWGAVYSPARYKEEILAILQDLRKGEYDLP
ncbi:MAG: hypothetical protein CVV03_12720 [Firmicutes bacterium HGW-Firmicutes-8]|nr:MAG: hypothetical protein CVV03_12720 [Firmicutes bacterium HGW-Firmicutes-8]